MTKIYYANESTIEEYQYNVANIFQVVIQNWSVHPIYVIISGIRSTWSCTRMINIASAILQDWEWGDRTCLDTI